MPEPLRLRELLERLTEAEIRFVLVGGLAVNAWGYVRATRDYLIAMKRASERPRDRDDLEALEVARGPAESEG